jgi:hypothetical protein
MALLDASAGIQYVDEAPELATAWSMVVFDAWAHLSNGSGGIDFAGMPVVVEMLGIADPARLLDSIRVIREHRPARPEGD